MNEEALEIALAVAINARILRILPRVEEIPIGDDINCKSLWTADLVVDPA
jgi:hypothetical protein